MHEYELRWIGDGGWERTCVFFASRMTAEEIAAAIKLSGHQPSLIDLSATASVLESEGAGNKPENCTPGLDAGKTVQR